YNKNGITFKNDKFGFFLSEFSLIIYSVKLFCNPIVGGDKLYFLLFFKVNSNDKDDGSKYFSIFLGIEYFKKLVLFNSI
ncbi:hypothetical protein ACI3QP_12240, partial [Propionibacterium freudenreichii]